MAGTSPAAPAATPAAAPAAGTRLTPREAEVLRFLQLRLTNREIADQLVVSTRTVESHVASLLRKLGRGSRRELAAAAVGVAGPGVLPEPRDSFVGRGSELAALPRLLRAHRLVTLVGPPGVGKTRLALEAARRLSADLVVRVVELAPASGGGTVADRVLAALGGRQVPGQEAAATLRTEARADPMLVVLDNCEHVLADAAAVADVLLGRWPGTAVLATSRQPLGVPGELVRAVSPLEVPEPTAADAASVRDVDAVRLLLDRAAASGAGIEITDANADAVARLCRSLDGLPLAIELLAGRLRAYAPGQLAQRLDGGLSVVTGGLDDPGGSPLRAAIERSYRALAPADRALFASLAVFPSTFSLEAVERVCAGADTGDVVARLAGLVDRSLVSVVPADGTHRYRLLETLRSYADEQLPADGREPLQRRHAAFFTELAEEAEPHLRGGAGQWLQRLRADQDDLAAALDRSLGNDPVAALRLVGALWQFWQDTDQRRSGITWAERALARPADAPTEVRLRAVLAAARLIAPSDAGRCAQLVAVATGLADELDDPYWRARTDLITVTAAAYTTGIADESRAGAQRAAQDAVAYFRAVGDDWHAAETLQALSLTQPEAAAIGTLETARRLYERVGDELRAANCGYLTASVLVRALDEPARAARPAQEALAIALRLGNEHEAAHARSILAEVALREGDLPRAAEVAAECQDVFRRAADHRCVSAMALLLGTAAARQGDVDAARGHLHEALDVARLGAHRTTVPLARSLLATLEPADRAAR